MARIVSEQLTIELGQPVVVVNRPGASSNLAARAVIASAPDGYTLLLSTVTTNIAHALALPNSVDLSNEMSPVALVGVLSNVLVVNPASGIASLEGLVGTARRAPQPMTFGSAGTGSATHVLGALFAQKYGITLLHVPYTGGAQPVMDLIAGRINLMFATATTVIGQIEAGSLRAIATTGSAREAALAEVPTFSELGLGEFTDAVWLGISAPKNLPDQICDRLTSALRKAQSDSRMINGYRTAGITMRLLEKERFASFLAADVAKWKKTALSLGGAQ